VNGPEVERAGRTDGKWLRPRASDALSPLGVDVNDMPATPARLRGLIREASPVNAGERA